MQRLLLCKFIEEWSCVQKKIQTCHTRTRSVLSARLRAPVHVILTAQLQKQGAERSGRPSCKQQQAVPLRGHWTRGASGSLARSALPASCGGRLRPRLRCREIGSQAKAWSKARQQAGCQAALQGNAAHVAAPTGRALGGCCEWSAVADCVWLLVRVQVMRRAAQGLGLISAEDE
mmetsp:Transcript_48320/g.126341  ORF Transcript_48320/g.126341 Transcript_48320/m.126341 type:complete len:175 (-) Transcript_48320:672-1196(-)